jgi:hypothetical protein
MEKFEIFYLKNQIDHFEFLAESMYPEINVHELTLDVLMSEGVGDLVKQGLGAAGQFAKDTLGPWWNKNMKAPRNKQQPAQQNVQQPQKSAPQLTPKPSQQNNPNDIVNRGLPGRKIPGGAPRNKQDILNHINNQQQKLQQMITNLQSALQSLQQTP